MSALQKFCLTVHVLLIKWLRILLILLQRQLAKCSQTHAVCYPLQSEVSAHVQKPLIDNTLRDPC